MKKTKHKLALTSETIVHLTEERLRRVAGGGVTDGCFIMKDTIIIRTGGGIVRGP